MVLTPQHDDLLTIIGFAKRGMIFARKFSTAKTGALMDRIDEAFLFNTSSDAGLFWPGYFPTDIGRCYITSLPTTITMSYLICRCLLLTY